MTARSRTEMQKELTNFYNEDIMLWIKRQQTEGGTRMTYRQLSQRIADDTGYRIQPQTIARWVSYEKSGR